jgi:hypothetical protein
MSKRIGGLVALSAAGVIGVTAAGLSSAAATRPTTSVGRITTVSSVSSGRDAHRTTTALRISTTRTAALRERQAKVIKAVLAKHPHATVLKLVPRRHGSWLVALRLADHRVGTVLVDHRLRVGPFVPNRAVHAAPAQTRPSSTDGLGGDGAVSGPHW